MKGIQPNKKKMDGVGVVLYVAYLLMLLASVLLVVRILFIQATFRPDPEIEKKLTPPSRMVKIEASRGNILAEDGRMLALTYPEFTVYMDCTSPSAEIWKDSLGALCKGLASVTGSKSPSEYRQILEKGRRNGSRYLKLCDGLDITQMHKVRELPIFCHGKYRGGLIVETKNKRHYPYGKLGRRTIGFVRDAGSTVGNKYVGIEGKYDETLRGTDGKFWTARTDFGYVQRFDSSYTKASDGLNVRTTLNIDYQTIADNALRKNIESDPSLEGGCVVLMDVKTGAIRAMVNLMRGSAEGSSLEEISNLAIGRRGEPGSVFKTSCLMIMLKDGHVTSLDDCIPTNHGVLAGYRYAPDEHITDYERIHNSRNIPIIEGFKVSSNYMFRYLAVKHYGNKPDTYIKKLQDLHLGDPFEFDIEGLASPTLPNPKSPYWSKTDLTGAATGYAVDQTPLQILTFYNAIANKGRMMKPYLVESIEQEDKVVKAKGPTVLDQGICSAAIADTLTRALKAVTEEGTAHRLKTARCAVAGKTGTARVALDTGGYSDAEGRKKQQGTFVGFFPAEDPQYSIICTVYSYLSHKDYYGGTIPAATVKEIVDNIYGIDPYWQEGIAKSAGLPQADSVTADAPVIENGQIKVPDLTGLGLKDAMFKLENMGLVCSYEGMGHIVSQAPKGGTAVPPGSEITIKLD